jgi:hypothetical protein
MNKFLVVVLLAMPRPGVAATSALRLHLLDNQTLAFTAFGVAAQRHSVGFQRIGELQPRDTGDDTRLRVQLLTTRVVGGLHRFWTANSFGARPGHCHIY